LDHRHRSGPLFENNSLRGLTLLVLLAGAIVSCVLFALSAAQRSRSSAEGGG
jgi:hypothetical protein